MGNQWKWCVEDASGNILKGWYEDKGKWYYLKDNGIMATGWIKDKDIILTDPIGKENLDDFKEHQVSKKLMNTANKGAILNPCPPFFRGQEVSEDVINSKYFVGYEFKKSLLEVQQAIIIYCMNNNE